MTRGRVVAYRVALESGDTPYERFEAAIERAVRETKAQHWRHQVRRVRLNVGYRWIVQRHSSHYGLRVPR